MPAPPAERWSVVKGILDCVAPPPLALPQRPICHYMASLCHCASLIWFHLGARRPKERVEISRWLGALGPFNSANIVSNEKIILTIILLCLPVRALGLWIYVREHMQRRKKTHFDRFYICNENLFAGAATKRLTLWVWRPAWKIAIGGRLIYSLAVVKIRLNCNTWFVQFAQSCVQD